MPVTFVTTPTTPNGYTIVAPGTHIFDTTASVFHDNGTGISIIDGTDVTTELFVNSTVVSGATTAYGIRSNGSDRIVIGATGSVYVSHEAVNNQAIRVEGTDTTVANAGTVSGAIGILANYSYADRTHVANTGDVLGRRIGVSIEGEENTLVNSGTISSQGIGVLSFQGGGRVENSGQITGGRDGNGGVGAAVWFDATASDPRNVLVNSGTITAQVHPTSGERFAVLDANFTTSSLVANTGGRVDVHNTGLIDGDVVLLDGEDRLYNFGTVIGAVGMGDDSDVVRNSGVIDGTVDLGAGNDVYNGSGTSDVSGGVYGSAGDDMLFGGNLADVMHGGDNADTVRGFDGDDSLTGDAGQDMLGGGNGNDTLDGGTENDTLNGGAGNDVLIGGNGNDSLFGGADDDNLTGNAKNDTLRGGTGDDTLDGGNDNDFLHGQQGNDVLLGSAGFDTLFGGGGDDNLDGGGRNDQLDGGTGNDTLTGSGGADRFIFGRNAGNDVVTDFTDGTDRIDLTAFGLQNFNALNTAGALNAEAGGVWIDLGVIGGSGTIWLDGVNLGQLDATDFLF